MSVCKVSNIMCVCVCAHFYAAPSKGENMKHSLSYLMSGDGAKECCSVRRRYSRGLSTSSQHSVISLTTVCVCLSMRFSECAGKK